MPVLLQVKMRIKNAKKCEGWDSNPRTPTRLGPQPSAFDLAWLPSPDTIVRICNAGHSRQALLLCHNKEVVYLKECYGMTRDYHVRDPVPREARAQMAAAVPVCRVPGAIRVFAVFPMGFFQGISRGKSRFCRAALPDRIRYPDGRLRAYMYIFIRFTRCIYVG